MKTFFSLATISILLSAGVASAQPLVLSVEELPLGSERAWQNPRFSPNGTSVFYTSPSFEGIWEYSLESKSTRQITSDPHSGYGYSISPDGRTIAYRRTIIQPSRRRTQEIIVKDLRDHSATVVDSGPNLSTPAFTDRRLSYTKGEQTRELSLSLQGSEIEVLGIENTKIALLKGNTKVLLDPFGKGSYIWPSLSPDKTQIVAYEMERGTFVADIEGTVLATLGRRNAPSWTFDGKWIVYMDDRDDGHQILESDIRYVSADGTKSGRLTETADVIELNPQCSPTDPKIVYHTLDGRIFLLTYSE
ncbi:MAG: PD40 domain-containing protein [Ignavibacteriales bacterium]|nr:PD40 domain-containing protein [Ignavibacteriales bacterium]